MRTDVVLTVTGPDRVGVVEDVTRALLELGASVSTSRMTRLGGAFAILMMASLPEARVGDVEAALSALSDAGYRITCTSTETTGPDPHAGWPAYSIEISGADHEGIVHEIAAGLSRRGITIESAETGVVAASVSGAPLFTMSAEVLVPPSLSEDEWSRDLEEAGRLANVDIAILPSDADVD